MFERLFGRRDAEPQNYLPEVRHVTLGRGVRVDPLAWRRFGDATKFQLDRDTLEIVAQGFVPLNEGGFVHRFYTDDDVMFQAVTTDRAGNQVNDVTLFVPWDSAYPSSNRDYDLWNRQLRAPSIQPPGLPAYRRLWFGDASPDQAPVTFWEEIHDDRDGIPDRRIFQTCMLYARDLPGEGRELLLAITQEPEGGDVSFELMIGVALELGEFSA